jgi:protein-S-isoprenylcysteine O-methyltransferase Ste14
MSAWRHGAAILLLPFMATVVVPALLEWNAEVEFGPLFALGVLLVAVGLLLFVTTVALFARIGQGTLAPWDPTSKLVVRGPYRHVRNPMISGVLCLLLGEAALLGAAPLLAWFGGVFAVNAVYLPLVEEPGLVRRFGADYESYRNQVPRWVPRLRPWAPGRSAQRGKPG